MEVDAVVQSKAFLKTTITCQKRIKASGFEHKDFVYAID
jgi:hypothetical protein